ncbi:hypothetical protein [Nonomuraea dietziae]|uniref:hypothetical protein n=1 Tax=Nonomuraea dietziae TaxID=65515 RepID=UPI0031D39D30
MERNAISGLMTARRTDGSGSVELPGSTTEGPILNRFVVLRLRAGLKVIKDLRAGTLATFDPAEPALTTSLGDRTAQGTLLALERLRGPRSVGAQPQGGQVTAFR